MEVRAGYKQTEIGVIPDDWETYKVSQFTLAHKQGFYTKNPYVPEGVKLARITDLHFNKINFDDMPSLKISEDDFKQYKISEGDFLFARSGAIGRYGIVSEPVKAIFGSYIIRFVLNAKLISNYYFGYAYQAEFTNKQLLSITQGSSNININAENIKALKIPIPKSKIEQDAIAEALIDADTLIESLEKLIEKKRQIKQGVMQELLTGKKRLSGFSGDWNEKPLGEICHIKTGSRNNQDKVEDGQYPFFVRSSTVERINSYTHDCEAILIPGEGGIGSIFHYIVGKFDVHQRVYAITQFPEDVCGKYIYLYMSVHFGFHAMQNSVKATVDSLRLPTFQEFKIKLPPTKVEQEAVAKILSDMDLELAELDLKHNKAREIKQGMMQELLTGRIRLV